MLNAGFWACFILSWIFATLGLGFAMLKDRGAMLVSGFNSMPKEEREKYDQAAIARSMRNSCLLWALILLVGAFLSLINSWFSLIAIVLWAILFFRQVFSDSKKGFARYRLPVSEDKETEKNQQ